MGASLTPAALDAGLARLVAAGTITAAQAQAVREAVTSDRVAGAAHAVEGTAGAAPADRTPWTALLAEIGGYVGATFVFGAAAVFAASAWSDLSRTARLLVFAVPALLAIAAAAAVATSVPGRWSPREAAPGSGPRRRLVATLVVLAAGLTAGAADVLLAPSGDPLIVSSAALVVLVGGYAACRSSLLHVATAFTALLTGFAVRDAADLPLDAAGIGAVALGAAWAGLALARVLAERQLGLVTGAVLAFIGGESLAIGTLESGAGRLEFAGYAVLGLVAVAALVGYVRLRYVGLLAAGTVALAVVVPQFVLDVTDGALGAAGALLVCGLSIGAASVVGLRLKSAAPAV
jgi:hypothetical protein